MSRTSAPFFALLMGLGTLLLTGAANPDERAVLELSQHGSVLGPMLHAETAEDEALALSSFVEGLEAMGEGDYLVAAERFDGVFDRTGWPEARYNGALAWYAAGRFDVALERAGSAYELLPDDTGVMFLQGVLLQATGRHADATDVIQRSLARSRGEGSRMDEAIALLNLGTSSALLGRPVAALEHFASVAQLGAELESPVLIAAAHMGEARVHLVRGDRAAADAALASARRLGRKKGYDAAQADADLSFAAVALAEGKSARAGQLLASAGTHIDAVEDPSIQASMLLTLADLLREMGEVEAASASLARSSTLFEQGGLEVGRAHGLTLKGGWALQDGELEAAERALQESLAIQDRFQVPLARAETLRTLAAVRSAQGRMDEALSAATEALAVFVGADAVELERATLVVLTEIRSVRGELVEAREAAARAIELSSSVGDSREVHRVRSEVVILRAAQGDLDGALEELRRVPAAALRRMPARQRARVHLQLAWSLREAGRLDDSVDRGRKALAATREGSGMDSMATGARETIVFALVEGGRTDEAEAFLQKEGGDEDLSEYVRSKRTIDTYNAGVRLLEAGDLPGAVALLDELRRAEDPDPGRREVVNRTLQSARLQLGQSHADAGRLDEASGLLQGALELAEERDDPGGQARALIQLAQIAERRSDLATTADLAGRAARLAGQAGETGLAGDCWMISGQALFEVDPEGSRAAFSEALASWGTSADTLGKRAGVTYNLAALDLARGDDAEAAVRFREALILADEAGNDDLQARIDEILGSMEPG